MSDLLKHECGLAFVRLLKPLEDYDTPYWGLHKLQILLEKQRHRGHDGAGVAVMKIDVPPGTRYISRHRSNDKSNPTVNVFEKIYHSIEKSLENDTSLTLREAFELKLQRREDSQWLFDNAPFIGNIYLGHVRYGTYGTNSMESIHPFLRQNNWKNRNLIVAGNFNMTNAPDQFAFLNKDLGQHPKEISDTVTVMEKIGHFLDDAIEKLHLSFKDTFKGQDKQKLSKKIGSEIDVQKILINASKDWDGGYVICGIIGNGDSFILRDPHGIRPAFFYKNSEVLMVASERPCIQIAMDVDTDSIQEIPPGNALIADQNGSVYLKEIFTPTNITPCSFERFYFSKGTDRDIYLERKKLGAKLAQPVEKIIASDFRNTVFSFIPESSEIAFLGLTEALTQSLNRSKCEIVKSMGSEAFSNSEIPALISDYVRQEKVILKDKKMRTFISSDQDRKSVTNYAYDLAYGTVKNHETLVLVDDSIIRGNTLENQILTLVKKLNPKKIVVVSSAPLVKYPDCYGIDMSKLSHFIAFRAAKNLYTKFFGKQTAKEKIRRLVHAAEKATDQKNTSKENFLQQFYQAFSDKDLIEEMEHMLYEGAGVKVHLVFQKVEDLYECCPKHRGDWYFTGNYPTPGGVHVANRSLRNSTVNSQTRDYEPDVKVEQTT